MAQIFISYSRADAQFISDLVPLLQETYGVASVFYDEQIPGGTKWWEIILREVAACDLFIYLCSNELLQSPYCQSELREAVRLQKQIIPVIVRPKTNYPYAGVDYGTVISDDIAVILRDTNCIDLSRGFRDRELGPKASARLYGAINKALESAPSRQPPPLTPYPTAQPQVNDKKNRSWLNEPRAIVVAALITGVFAIVAVVIPLIGNGQNVSQTQETPIITLLPPTMMQEITTGTSLPTESPAASVAPSPAMVEFADGTQEPTPEVEQNTPVTQRLFIEHTETPQNWSIGQCLEIASFGYARNGPGINFTHIQDGLYVGRQYQIIGGPTIGLICSDPNICNLDDQGYWWELHNEEKYRSGYPYSEWVWQGKLAPCS